FRGRPLSALPNVGQGRGAEGRTRTMPHPMSVPLSPERPKTTAESMREPTGGDGGAGAPASFVTIPTLVRGLRETPDDSVAIITAGGHAARGMGARAPPTGRGTGKAGPPASWPPPAAAATPAGEGRVPQQRPS